MRERRQLGEDDLRPTYPGHQREDFVPFAVNAAPDAFVRDWLRRILDFDAGREARMTGMFSRGMRDSDAGDPGELARRGQADRLGRSCLEQRHEPVKPVRTRAAC